MEPTEQAVRFQPYKAERFWEVTTGRGAIAQSLPVLLLSRRPGAAPPSAPPHTVSRYKYSWYKSRLFQGNVSHLF